MPASQLEMIVAQEFERALPAFEAARPRSRFSRWGGWSVAVGLADLLAGRAPAIFRNRGINLYRIVFPGGAVSVGMTETNSVATRLHQHANTAAGEQRIRARINAVPLSRRNAITVQAGRWRTRRGLTIREAHMYEIWLQMGSRVFDWRQIRNTRTFE